MTVEEATTTPTTTPSHSNGKKAAGYHPEKVLLCVVWRHMENHASSEA